MSRRQAAAGFKRGALMDIKDKINKLIEHMAVETASKNMYKDLVKQDVAHLKLDRSERSKLKNELKTERAMPAQTLQYQYDHAGKQVSNIPAPKKRQYKKKAM